MPDRANIKILIIEDDEDDFYLTEQMIRKIPSGNFDVQWCRSHKEGLKLIREASHDIYFIDYFLPGMTGMELLTNSIAVNADTPRVLLTGQGNRDIAMQALDAGAADYLVKSELTAEKLERCIRYAVEKSQALKQLRDNEQKFRNIFEKTRDAIFLSDTDLVLRDVNTAMANLMGGAAESLIGSSVYDMMADEKDLQKVKDSLNEQGEVNDLEINFHDQAGDELSCIFSAITIANPDGSNYVQGILHDITKLKKAEKSALMSEKLAATGRLARTLAHEIRDPLTNINLSLDYLNELDADEEQRGYYDIIRRNSVRVNDILSELLAAGKAGHTSLQRVNLQDILDASVHAAMDRMHLKKIKPVIRYTDQLATILADKDSLTMAFLNIIINAIEAMSDDNGRLMVVIEDDGTQWEVKITDNGCGIAAEDLPKLFEPFYTAKRNGLGLGLSTTLNILQSHHGSVDVNSVLNVGTTFSIQFPKAQAIY